MHWLLAASIGFLLAGFLIGWIARSFGLARSAEKDCTPDLAKALSRAIDGDRDEAIRLLTSITSQQDSSIDPFLTLAVLFRKKGWLHRAADLHRRLLQRNDLTDSARGIVHLEIARDFLECGLWERCSEAAQQAYRHAATQHDAARFLARLRERERNWDEAIGWWKRSSGDIRKLRPIPYIQAARVSELLDRMELKDAARILGEALADDPENAALQLESIRLTLMKADLGDPATPCEVFLRLRSDLTGFLVDRLDAFKQPLPESLIACLMDRIQVQSTHATGRLEQVSLLMVLNRPAEARRTFETIDFRRLSPDRLAKYCGIAEKLNCAALACDASREWMRRAITRDGFRCRDCGQSFGRMTWRCPVCEMWGTLYATDPELNATGETT